MKYATGTQISEQETRLEVLRLLVRNGCRNAEAGLNAAKHGVCKFEVAGRKVRMLLPLPDEGPFGTGNERARRWRVLLLLLKAKLEAVDSGISTVQDEFMAHIAMPNGQTAGEIMAPQISEAYQLSEARR